MSGWNDPRFIITVLLILLFAGAYAADTSDQAMKGAIIGAFSAAYGFWIGSAQQDKRSENTGKAFDAILSAQDSMPRGPIKAEIVNSPAKPVPTTDESASQSGSGDASATNQDAGAPEGQNGSAGADGAPSAVLPDYAR